MNEEDRGIILGRDGDRSKDGLDQNIEIMPTGEVRCPNHGCVLEGVPFPMPDKGYARCPVSKASFEYTAKIDPDMTVQLKDGTVAKMPFWEVKGQE